MTHSVQVSVQIVSNCEVLNKKVQTLEENVFKQGHQNSQKKTGYENLIVQATICVTEGVGLHGKYKTAMLVHQRLS